MQFNKKSIILLITATLLVSAYIFFPIEKSIEKEVNHINSVFVKKQQLATDMLTIISNQEVLNYEQKTQLADLNKKEGIAFFTFEKNEPVFWTNREVVFDLPISELKHNKTIQCKNGWYHILKRKKEDKTYLATILLKTNYQITNKHLVNNLHSSFKANYNYNIHLKKSEWNISNLENTFVFSLKQPVYSNKNAIGVKVFLFFIWVLLIAILVTILSFTLFKNNIIAVVFPAVFLIFLRVVFYQFNFPFFLYNHSLFDPSIYAQSNLLSSFGDFLLSVELAIFIIYLSLHKLFNQKHNNKFLLHMQLFIAVVIPLLSIYLMSGLVNNSVIDFDLTNVFDNSYFSWLAIILISIKFLISIIFMAATYRSFIIQKWDKKWFAAYYIFIYLIGVLFFVQNKEIGFSMLIIWPLAVLIVLFVSNIKLKFYRFITYVLFVAILIAVGLIQLENSRAKTTNLFLAKKLIENEDHVVEFLYDGVKEKIVKDTTLQNQIPNYWQKKENIDKYIIDKYFGGFWSKYDVNITSCEAIDTILIEPDNIKASCVDYFTKKVKNESQSIVNKNTEIHYLVNSEGIGSYFSIIEFVKKSNEHYLFIELLPKVFSKAEGYPELLLNEKEAKRLDLDNKSYGKYQNNKLIQSSGEYKYSLVLDKQPINNGYYEQGNYKHLLYTSGINTILLSSKKQTVLDMLTVFSYLLILTLTVALIIGWVFKLQPLYLNISITDFSSKIQVFVIALIFFSSAIFVVGTSYYVKKQNSINNKNNLSEKVRSVLTELEHKLAKENELTPDLTDYITYYLIKFSNVFYTDINLYNTKGELLASSRPEVFEKGLISKRMERQAWEAMYSKKKSEFTHNESIGGLSFLSTYVPFRNQNNKILAYLNLPYFAKQNKLESELSGFYSALINIYALLFLLSTFIAVLFASYISTPLRIIKNKIGRIQLGKRNELLDWTTNDEIGALVNVYNLKVLELEKNAKKLAKSERESAWREMAKQVAHEIKNPLTPMKLSIQHLQRSVNSNPDDMVEKINKTTQTVIEQIDTLTNIANEFANFAKMPKANAQPLNPALILENTIILFAEQGFKIEFINQLKEELLIVIDKDQLQRVFNNLIKNATQAVEDISNPKISIKISYKNNNILISIQDNGVGISEELKEKIFVPNFTTKTTGTGLGLAMVKNIVETSDGEIWFESLPPTGTTFYLSFPVNK